MNPPPIDESKISVNALRGVNRLNESGFQAYLVGGCIRDLLLGKSAKDFDVATSAHTEDVRNLFRNSRVIGRRFRIVHVRFGREVVEVTTFRGPHEERYEENHSESGMTLSDNIYGTFEEDVFRRDFTMNAIYYQPNTGEMIDLTQGAADIGKQIIRTIGAPDNRLREDPVRMLRAIRFQAKLGFQIEASVTDTIKSLGFLIQDVSPARLFEEVLKLFLSGYGLRALESLLEHDLYGWIFPDSKRAMADRTAEQLVRLALESTDTRLGKGLSVTPAFIYAAILWWPFIAEKKRLVAEGLSPFHASHEAASNVIAKQLLFTSIPKRFSGPVRDIWFLQSRLPIRTGRKPDVLVGHRWFRAAYDFLLLREESGENTDGLGDWWTRYQEADETTRQTMKQPGKKNRNYKQT